MMLTTGYDNWKLSNPWDEFGETEDDSKPCGCDESEFCWECATDEDLRELEGERRFESTRV